MRGAPRITSEGQREKAARRHRSGPLPGRSPPTGGRSRQEHRADRQPAGIRCATKRAPPGSVGEWWPSRVKTSPPPPSCAVLCADHPFGAEFTLCVRESALGVRLRLPNGAPISSSRATADSAMPAARIRPPRGYSSAGRAPGSHPGGRQVQTGWLPSPNSHEQGGPSRLANHHQKGGIVVEMAASKLAANY